MPTALSTAQPSGTIAHTRGVSDFFKSSSFFSAAPELPSSPAPFACRTAHRLKFFCREKEILVGQERGILHNVNIYLLHFIMLSGVDEIRRCLVRRYKKGVLYWNKQRSSFSSRIGFVLAAAGSAVGLGNLWRFPYLAAKYGGGIFLLVYIILAITFGFALMITEIAISEPKPACRVSAHIRRSINASGPSAGLPPLSLSSLRRITASSAAGL